MDLTTQYLGLTLSSPLVASANPMAENLENVKRMAEAGASAIVLPSLFEEQLRQEQIELHHHTTYGTESFPEALTYFPEQEEYEVGPDRYLEHIRRAKEAVEVPIIASLNGSTLGGWTDFAANMEQAGADAIELNIYGIPTDINMSGSHVEAETVEIVKAVKGAVTVPVAVKLSPFYSNMANMAKQLADAGADGLVLFNRFYQPDVDLETLEVRPNVLLSTAQALRLPLRWIAILHGRVEVDLAATSGVHAAADAIKLLLVGAKVTMMASAIIRNGIDHLRLVESGLVQWMDENEYDSVQLMQGSLSQINSGDPSGFERVQYMRAVSSIPDDYAKLYNL
jgi:dihydroorotate dehydrogenase (fumarate)